MNFSRKLPIYIKFTQTNNILALLGLLYIYNFQPSIYICRSINDLVNEFNLLSVFCISLGSSYHSPLFKPGINLSGHQTFYKFEGSGSTQTISNDLICC